jgi:LysR family transcriptional regulator, glycine cleavage system transcriptional activator
MWLIPRLKQLEQGPPPLRIVLNIDIRQNDLADEGIDLSVRCGRSGIPGRVSLRLFEEWLFPIASPDLALSIGKGDPSRLLKYPLIHDSDATGWRAWLEAADIHYRPRAQDRRFEDYNLVLDAAANGLGIALARPPLVSAQVESGRLAVVDERTVLNPVSYWMDRPEGKMRPVAAELARRVAGAAGVESPALESFLAV